MQINYSFVIMAFLCHVQKEQHRGDIFSTFVDFGPCHEDGKSRTSYEQNFVTE